MGRGIVYKLARWCAASGGRATHHSVAAYERTRRVLTVAVCAVAVGSVLGLGALVGAQTGAAPRTVWGEPDLMGTWQAAKLGARPGQDTFNLMQLERLYRPEVGAKLKQLAAEEDPAHRCLPTAYPRTAALGWPIQILQSPNMLFVFNEAFHTQRMISTDGRPQTLDVPTYQGDSAGHWEGGTLVVDVISFNAETWLAGTEDKPTNTSPGVWPTSDALHVVERWRRVDADTLEYRARVEDPQMLSGPWEPPTVIFKRQRKDWIEEVKCLLDDVRVPAYNYLRQFGR